MGNSNTYPIPVTTPNGPGLLIGRGITGDYLVRHPKGATIDKELCQQVVSASHVNGLLAWYQKIEKESR